MAAEVDKEGHLFRPKQRPIPSWARCQEVEHYEDLLDQKDLKSLFADCLDAPDSSNPPFDFGPLHDLESLWWLVTYYVFEWALQEIPDKFANSREEARVAKLRTVAHKLFNDKRERRCAMSEPGKFASMIKCLRGDVLRAAQALEEWRLQLVARYAETEKSSEAVAHPNFAGLHSNLSTTINTIRGLLPPTESESRVPSPVSRKRTRAADAELPDKHASPPKKRRRA